MASLKLPIKTSTAKNDIGAQAPSLDEAEAILARFGYKEAVEEMALAV